MNRSFRLVWNAALGLWVVASEAAKGKSKTKSKNRLGRQTLVQKKESTPIAQPLKLASIILLTSMGAPIFAATTLDDGYNWSGNDNSDWEENWTDGPGGALLAAGPTSANQAFIEGSNATLKGSSETDQIHIGFADGSARLILQDSAALKSKAAYIGDLTTSYGEVILTGSDASWQVLEGTFAVANYGEGKVTVNAGASLTTNGKSYIGRGKSSDNTATGTAIVTGLGSHWTINNEFYVGQYGTGTLIVSNGADVNATQGVTIGSEASSEGTVNIGAAESEEAAAAGTLSVADGKAITFGDGAGTLVFNHTDTNYEFASKITGGTTENSNINIVHGTTQFTGDLSSYTGKTNVKGGTLFIASGKTLTLGGDYHQTAGTLKVGATSATDFGKLKVSGAATFAKDSKIDVDVSEKNSLGVGTKAQVVEAKELTSAGFVVTDNSALLDFTASVEGNTVSLTAVQGTDNSDSSDKGNSDSSDKGNSGTSNSKGNSSSSDNKATVVKYVQNQNFTPGLGAAKVLDTLLSRGASTGTNMDAVVTALNKLSTGESVSEAVAQTLPLLSGSSSKVSSGVMHANSNVVTARQSSTANVSSAGRSVETGTSSGDGFISDGNAWVKPVGSWAKQDSRGNVSGYDAETYGVIGGMDGNINDTTSIGFALSYMNTKADGKGTSATNNADIDVYQVMFYGQRNLGEGFHNLDFTWQAAAGVNQTDGTRNINFMSATAKSDYTSYTGNLSAGLGRTFAINGDTSLTPSVRADYSYIKDESYKETGADALNLNVRSNTAEAFLISVNGDLNQRINDSLSWAASAGVGYDVMNETSTLTASYTGGGAAFTTEGLELSPWVINAGVGMNYALDDATEISVRYDLEGRSDFLSQTATAKFTWVF